MGCQRIVCLFDNKRIHECVFHTEQGEDKEAFDFHRRHIAAARYRMHRDHWNRIYHRSADPHRKQQRGTEHQLPHIRVGDQGLIKFDRQDTSVHTHRLVSVGGRLSAVGAAVLDADRLAGCAERCDGRAV